jgi:hypothetical protein
VRSRKAAIGIDTIKTDKIKQQFADFVQQKWAVGQTVQPAPNGIRYISDYRNWTIISITDRFDNGTLRMIYGNDIAIRLSKHTGQIPARWRHPRKAAGSKS